MTSLAQRTLDLCLVPSPIGEEKALCDQLEAWACGRFGAANVRRVGHSLVVGDLADPRPTVALVGHLDTVPAHPGDGPPRIEGGRVHGLGASDMKGGVAVALALADQLDLAALPYNLVLMLYEREEGPFEGNGLGPLFAQIPQLSRIQLALCMEPTDHEVQPGCVGGLQATLTFTGKRAHSARPWHGENAITKAGAFLAELHTRPRTRVVVDGLEFFEVFSVTLAQGGHARNVIPDQFTLNLNHRFAPGKSVEQAEAELRALVAGRALVEITDRSPSGRVCLDNPLLQKLIAAGNLTVTAKQAWTDVARFGLHGIDAVNFGPGETAQAHQAGESCPIALLDRAYDTLEAFLASPAVGRASFKDATDGDPS
jgi:succinyl-diaminopimelate desuccinylase